MQFTTPVGTASSKNIISSQNIPLHCRDVLVFGHTWTSHQTYLQRCMHLYIYVKIPACKHAHHNTDTHEFLEHKYVQR